MKKSVQENQENRESIISTFLPFTLHVFDTFDLSVILKRQEIVEMGKFIYCFYFSVCSAHILFQAAGKTNHFLSQSVIQWVALWCALCFLIIKTFIYQLYQKGKKFDMYQFICCVYFICFFSVLSLCLAGKTQNEGRDWGIGGIPFIHSSLQIYSKENSGLRTINIFHIKLKNNLNAPQVHH